MKKSQAAAACQAQNSEGGLPGRGGHVQGGCKEEGLQAPRKLRKAWVAPVGPSYTNNIVLNKIGFLQNTRSLLQEATGWRAKKQVSGETEWTHISSSFQFYNPAQADGSGADGSHTSLEMDSSCVGTAGILFHQHLERLNR